MTWQPNSGVAAARARAEMTSTCREFFATRQILEVNTPVLSATTVTDPNIESLATGTGSGAAFLQTSPEYFMKRLLASGYPDIYQIGPVFRDAECGRRHLPEFTMIEWYRLGFGLREMMEETVALICALLPRLTLSLVRYCSYQETFLEQIGLDPLTANVDALAEATSADSRLRTALGSDRDAWLSLAITTHIAPAFDRRNLTVIFHYPESQAALARSCPDDRRVADRFEVYLGELELCNGFVELADAQEQQHRFKNDQRLRKAAGRAVHDIDHALLAALQHGLPPCAGVAVGLERLLMLQLEENDINHVVTFTPGQ